MHKNTVSLYYVLLFRYLKRLLLGEFVSRSRNIFIRAVIELGFRLQTHSASTCQQLISEQLERYKEMTSIF